MLSICPAQGSIVFLRVEPIPYDNCYSYLYWRTLLDRIIRFNNIGTIPWNITEILLSLKTFISANPVRSFETWLPCPGGHLFTCLFPVTRILLIFSHKPISSVCFISTSSFLVMYCCILFIHYFSKSWLRVQLQAKYIFLFVTSFFSYITSFGLAIGTIIRC